MQEAVFETLTKQYEMAKVEEARETPSVKVLDVADVPERKSYPPRMVFMFFGTGLLLVLACVWVLARARWHDVDPANPAKVLAVDVVHTVRANRIVDSVFRIVGLGNGNNSLGRS